MVTGATTGHPPHPPDPLPHVSTLAGQASPYLPSYAFLEPFGGQPVLLEASCPPGDLFLPCGWPTDREGERPHSAVRPPEGFHVSHR